MLQVGLQIFRTLGFDLRAIGLRDVEKEVERGFRVYLDPPKVCRNNSLVEVVGHYFTYLGGFSG